MGTRVDETSKKTGERIRKAAPAHLRNVRVEVFRTHRGGLTAVIKPMTTKRAVVPEMTISDRNPARLARMALDFLRGIPDLARAASAV